MLYDYLITFFKVIVGLITTERLVYVALIALAIYLIWVCLALLKSFQRKFYKNSLKLYNYIRNNQNLSINDEILNNDIKKISSGFYYGWKKFKRADYGKPSDYIKRRDALDVEINGGVLNQGKSFMKAYISFVFIALMLFNFAYYGNTQTITFYLIGESLVLPLVILFIMKIFYFLFTSVKQQLYKSDIEAFYELIDLFDEKFSKTGQPVSLQSVNEQLPNETIVEVGGLNKNTEAKSEINNQLDSVNNENQLEIADSEINSENSTEAQDGEAVVKDAEVENSEEGEEPKTEQNGRKDRKASLLDEYDVFKKKNIDVEKLINEVPASSSSLPYINVDSDYVIKDDNKPTTQTKHSSMVASNGSEVLGGMMQDMSSIKKSNSFIETEKEIAKIDEEKLKKLKNKDAENAKTNDNELKSTEKGSDEIEVEDVFSSLEQFEIKPDNEKDIDGENLKDNKQDTNLNSDVEHDSSENLNQEPAVKTEGDNEGNNVVSNESNQSTEDVHASESADIATIVGGFKPHRSKLASGGVEIQKNEPLARRRKSEFGANDNESVSSSDSDINVLSVDENTDNVLNSLKGNLYSSEDSYNNYENADYQEYSDNEYVQQPESTYNSNDYAGYGYGAQYAPNQSLYQPNYTGGMQQPYGGFGGYGAGGYGGMQQPNMYDQNLNNYNGFNTSYDDAEVQEPVQEIESQVQDEPAVIKRRNPAKTKAAPVSKNSKGKGEKKVEENTSATRGRGRPKKQVFDESLTIKDDKEFDEVLSRAEKLMKKSEEGLSQSQSKRIEKELKMLMDAMNRYKERK